MLLNEKLKTIIGSDAKIINVERVSLWLLDNSHSSITAENIYSLTKNQYIPGLTLQREEYPNYFQAIESSLTVDVADAVADPRTSEFSNSYLIPNGITSLLDIPIRIGGDLIGILCHEHVGEKRNWSIDDIRFASSIADLIALAIENSEKEQISNDLSEIKLRYESASAK